MATVARLTSTTSEPPLCVDLDGTVISTDLLWESVAALLKRRPLLLLLLPFWLLRGRAHLKAELARRVSVDPTTLPYRAEVVDFLRAEQAAGRHIVLATAANRRLAEGVADHLGVFAEVLASDGTTNLSGHRKSEALQRRFGAGRFDYAGDAAADVAVWKAGRAALVVGRGGALRKQLEPDVPIAREFSRGPSVLAEIPRALRVHQWIKNVLVFVPIVLGHELGDPLRVVHAILAFFAFSFLASAVYLLNDLLDLEADRSHPRKCRRPLAAGTLPIAAAFALLVPMLLSATGLALLLPPAFLGALGAYLVLTTAYSFWLKRIPVLDVLVLALLYTMRVLAGGLATDVTPSPWLLALSLFLFQSLAVLKRYAELGLVAGGEDGRIAGRGYVRADRAWLGMVGTSCGSLAVLVLALYITSADVVDRYRHPEALWGASVLLLYWIGRLWFLAQREKIDDDPILITLRDRASWGIGAGLVATMLLAV